MNDLRTWAEANDAFLAAALRWLRASLRRLAASFVTSLDTPGDADSESGFAEFPTASEAGQRPALHVLGERLGLSQFERKVVLLCAAMELDPHLGELCAAAQGDASRAYPTFALCFQLFSQPSWNALSPERPLRRLRLLEISLRGHAPLTTCPLRADERVVNFVKGLNYLDDRLAPLLTPLATADPALQLPPSQQALVDGMLDAAHDAWRDDRPLPVFQLVGSDAETKQQLATAVAQQLDAQLYQLPAELLPARRDELEETLRLWQRERLLQPLAIYLDAADPLAVVARSSPLGIFLRRSGGLVFWSTADAQAGVVEDEWVIDVAKPTSAEQQSAWRQQLPGDVGETAVALAGQFNLNLLAIRQIAASCAHPRDASPADLPAKLWRACRRRTRPRLESLAQRVDAKATWEDLVLPGEETALLRQIVSQVRFGGKVLNDWGFRAKHNRGLGISVLFAGDSGTGKTMAAEVVANDLQLDLFRIDLSAVVNKYIGETEKNLRRLFDAADDGGAILFFDEADSLFGKRTEVRDSHDRYANLEVNYLLQRMESYRGLAILATNLQGALDTAFLRRLRFVVNFPQPEAAERRQLWRKAFPAEVPLGALDLDRLSRLSVSGGNIHTIALNAAFASLVDSPALAMPHILQAARAEFRKLQKPIDAADFRWAGVQERTTR